MYFINDWFSDIYILREILDCIEFQTSSTRSKNYLYMPKKHGGSMLYGSTFRQQPVHYKKQREPDPNNPKLNLTKAKSDSPELHEIFVEFSSLYFPNFKWNSVQMNKNYTIPAHFDSLNVGESVLVGAAGNYVNGLTCLYNEEKREIEKIDSRLKPQQFDGSQILHWSEQARGTDDRYTLVFFYSENI